MRICQMHVRNVLVADFKSADMFFIYILKKKKDKCSYSTKCINLLMYRNILLSILWFDVGGSIDSSTFLVFAIVFSA